MTGVGKVLGFFTSILNLTIRALAFYSANESGFMDVVVG